jgi:pyruvate dehydrogenase E1 component alpha subunit
MQAHTNADDATRYRSAEDVDKWVPKDPISRLRTYLREKSLLDDSTEERFACDAEDLAASIRAGLNAEVEVDPQELFAHVYTQKTAQLREQADLLRDELSREAVQP